MLSISGMHKAAYFHNNLLKIVENSKLNIEKIAVDSRVFSGFIDATFGIATVT